MNTVLLIGKSGSGKSTSLRNLPPEGTIIINVLGKTMPFRSDIKTVNCSDYDKIVAAVCKGGYDRYIIDDAGYLITNQFMSTHSTYGTGNAQYKIYNDIADKFWGMIRKFQEHPSQARVYIIMHEDKNDNGDIKPKTVGRLLDEKVCLEGMFTICLRSVISDKRYVFRTQSDGFDVCKSPLGMFPEDEIDNDLAIVDKTIVDYYNIGGKTNEKT